MIAFKDVFPGCCALGTCTNPTCDLCQRVANLPQSRQDGLQRANERQNDQKVKVGREDASWGILDGLGETDG